MRGFVLIVGLFSLPGCIEYGIEDDKPDGQDLDSGDPVVPPIGDDTGAVEACNGLDDDGDGDVDEGFTDADGDGVADCLDEACTVDVPQAGTVAVDGTCTAAPVEDPWNAEVAWAWRGFSTSPDEHMVWATPVVGQLTDDDGDGDIDADDDPDVVVAASEVSFEYGSLVVLDAATGAEERSIRPVAVGCGVALADLDGDGVEEMIGCDIYKKPTAWRADGSAYWTSTGDAWVYLPQPLVADVDGDGAPEVIADDLVLNGQTGAVERELTGTEPVYLRVASVGDLDLDGTAEVVVGNRVFDPLTGHTEWSASLVAEAEFTAIADTDGDPEGEVLFVGGGKLEVYDDDGTRLVHVDASDSPTGPPCVADFDGDGVSDVAWGEEDRLVAYHLDGTLLWQTPTSDDTGYAGCSAFDLDGDGAAEVLYADEVTFGVYDGATGAPRFTFSEHASVTLWEYPVVADLDGDGAAEILLASSDYDETEWSGVTAIRHAGAGWAPAGRGWPGYDFNGRTEGEYGNVPSPAGWWQTTNLYRSRPVETGALADLRAEVVDVCVASCDGGPVEVSVQVSNTGAADSPDRVAVTLYAVDGGALTPIETQTLSAPVAAGASTAGLVFETTADRIGVDGLLVRVDDDGSGTGRVTECVEDDNGGAWTDDPC